MTLYTKDGKVLPKNRIVIVKDGGQYINPQHDMLIAEGWEEYVEPVEPIEEYDKLAEIDNLKEALSTTDYKVIKCMEAYLCGEELPYDIDALHAERNAQRSEINKLEGSSNGCSDTVLIHNLSALVGLYFEEV